MSEHTEEEEYQAAILAAGGIWMALARAQVEVEPVMVEGLATNELIARFHFLDSPYRITVERVRDED